jgi:hypothetical protein
MDDDAAGGPTKATMTVRRSFSRSQRILMSTYGSSYVVPARISLTPLPWSCLCGLWRVIISCVLVIGYCQIKKYIDIPHSIPYYVLPFMVVR